MEHTTNATHATTKRVGLDVVNAVRNVMVNDAYRKMEANALVFDTDHLTIHPVSGLQQFSYRLTFNLDREVSIADARYIEEELATKMLNTFPDIDLHGGSVVGATTDSEIKGPTIEAMFRRDDTTLDADAFALGKKAEEEIKELMKSTKEMNKTNTVTPAELIDMAEYLEEKGVEVEDFDKMALAVWNSCLDGDYSEEVAIQILRTIDAMQMSDSYYEAYKPTEAYDGKRITIATFVWFAKEHGYKRGYLERYYVADKSKADVPTDVIEIEQYIDEEDIYNILVSDKKNVLIDSPTGSGKTTAAFPAIRRRQDEDENIYAFVAVPTKVLAIQTAKGKEAGTALYGRGSIKSVLKGNIEQTGYKLVVGTYDKIPHFIEYLEKIDSAKAIIVADEVHKEVTDYSYRKRAIKGLFGLRDHPQVDAFVGLSGTPQVVDKEEYDAMVRFKQKNAKPIFNQMHVLEYDQRDDFTKHITQLIAKEHKEGRKVLAFVIRKEIIQEIKDVLSGMGIKSAAIMNKPGNETKSATYRHISEKQTFPDGVDVVLATNAIADGVNILNGDENYTCIIAPHYQKSRIFEISTIKQMTNRFRHQYDRLIVPLFIKEDLERERREQTAVYGTEERHQTLLDKAERTCSFVKEKYEGRINEYKPSIIESINGMPYVNSHYADKDNFMDQSAFIREALAVERHLKANPKKQLNKKEIEMVEKLDHIRAHMFKVDKRTIRWNALRDSEEYYVRFPFAFVNAMEQILEVTSIMNTVDNYIQGLDKQVSEKVEKHLAEIEELKKETEKAKHERIDEVLTKEMFDAIKKDYFKRGRRILLDSPLWAQLSEVMSKSDVNVLKDILPFTSHSDVMKIAKNADNTTKRYAFKRSLRAIADLEGESETADTVKKIKQRIDAADFQTAGGEQCLVVKQIEAIKEEVAKEVKEDVSTIKSLYKQFFVSEQKKAKAYDVDADKKKLMHVRYGFRYINLNDVSKQYGIAPDNMANIYKQFKQELYEEAA